MSDLEKRFWSQVRWSKTCWEWKGTNNISVRGEPTTVRRVAALLFGLVDRFDEGQMVIRICKSKTCVRPDHLFVGSHADMNRNTVAKGTHDCGRGKRHMSRTRPDALLRGERHHKTKLTDAKVKEMRGLYARRELGWSFRKLARRYGVSYNCVRCVVNRETRVEL